MAALRCLLNPTSSTSKASGETLDHDTLDRAEEIAREVAENNTPKPSAFVLRPLCLKPPMTSTADIRYRPLVALSSTTTPTPPPSRANTPTELGSPAEIVRKTKIVKDAPVFVRGPTRGVNRYPPKVYLPNNAKRTHPQDRTSEDEQDEVEVEEGESQDENDDIKNNLQAYHDEYQVFPRQEEIKKYPRFIPYNSERRIYADATGRDFFEVFQYEFRPGRGGDEKMYTLLWDYNIGLVRTTPLFKCCGYGKTTPAKMLNKNVGLRDICHSITGGALVAQGYWMPYEAAKAVAATFCWSIRYALTPVFGIDFIDMCIPPDHEKFGVMLIDPEITKFCAEQAKKYRLMEIETPTIKPTISNVSSPRTPITSTFNRAIQPSRPGFKAINNTAKAFGDIGGASGYSTDVSSDGGPDSYPDDYVVSPSSAGGTIFRHPFKNTNSPRSTPRTALSTTPSPKTQKPRIKIRRVRDDDEEYESRITGASKKSSPALTIRERREDIKMMGIDGKTGLYNDFDHGTGSFSRDVEMGDAHILDAPCLPHHCGLDKEDEDKTGIQSGLSGTEAAQILVEICKESRKEDTIVPEPLRKVQKRRVSI